MLILGIWAIVIILLIAHWDKVRPVISGLLGLGVIISLLVAVGIGAYLVGHHLNDVFAFVGIIIGCLGAIYGLVFFVVSPIHMFQIVRKVGVKSAFKTALNHWTTYYIVASIIVVTGIFLWPTNKDYNKTVLLELWAFVLLILTLYSHGQLCKHYRPDCKMLPYLTTDKKK